MNRNSSSPPPTSQGQPKALPASMIRGAEDRLGVFDIAETIQRLCQEGAMDMGVAGATANPVQPSTGIGQSDAQLGNETAPSALGALPPTLSVLAPNFLQSIVNQLSKSAERAIGVAIVSKSGRVTQSADSGWKDGFSLVSKTLLNKISRECALQPTPRLSAEALNLVTPSSSPSATQPEPTKANGPQDTSVQNDSTTSPLANVRGSVCLNELSQSLGTPLLMFPIALEQSLGFAVFFCDASACHKVGPSAFCERASKLWLEASVFENLIQQLDSWLVVHRCNLFMKLVGFSEWIRTRPRWWLVPIGVSSMALFAPVPYFPKRECVFEPESKQYLSSPIQGRIASCDVRPGDRVEMDQLLAKLDDDELRRELATARAEFEGAEKKRDTALATRAMGNMGLADVEKQQALWRIESIEEQLRRLEIRASAAGVVVQGDWHRSVGMPVTLGQSLFEVATLESMTAEVRLNASDLGHINVGDEVSIRSDASGGTSFRGEISRIEPRATIIDDKAVFIADVVIHDPDLLLRPGMKATAQVKAGWKSLGWILFDRPYRWLANQWIW